MRVVVNGETKRVQATTLQDLLEECGYPSKAIATALNGEFVHRHLRLDTKVVEGDNIEVVSPIEGG